MSDRHNRRRGNAPHRGESEHSRHATVGSQGYQGSMPDPRSQPSRNGSWPYWQSPSTHSSTSGTQHDGVEGHAGTAFGSSTTTSFPFGGSGNNSGSMPRGSFNGQAGQRSMTNEQAADQDWQSGQDFGSSSSGGESVGSAAGSYPPAARSPSPGTSRRLRQERSTRREASSRPILLGPVRRNRDEMNGHWEALPQGGRLPQPVMYPQELLMPDESGQGGQHQASYGRGGGYRGQGGESSRSRYQ